MKCQGQNRIIQTGADLGAKCSEEAQRTCPATALFKEVTLKMWNVSVSIDIHVFLQKLLPSLMKIKSKNPSSKIGGSAHAAE